MAEFKVDDPVFAKVRGYSFWPARITAINGNEIKVEFYPKGQLSNLKKNAVVPFFENLYKLGKVKKPSFKEGIEMILNEMSDSEMLTLKRYDFRGFYSKYYTFDCEDIKHSGANDSRGNSVPVFVPPSNINDGPSDARGTHPAYSPPSNINDDPEPGPSDARGSYPETSPSSNINDNSRHGPSDARGTHPPYTPLSNINENSKHVWSNNYPVHSPLYNNNDNPAPSDARGRAESSIRLPKIINDVFPGPSGVYPKYPPSPKINDISKPGPSGVRVNNSIYKPKSLTEGLVDAIINTCKAFSAEEGVSPMPHVESASYADFIDYSKPGPSGLNRNSDIIGGLSKEDLLRIEEQNREMKVVGIFMKLREVDKMIVKSLPKDKPPEVQQLMDAFSKLRELNLSQHILVHYPKICLDISNIRYYNYTAPEEADDQDKEHAEFESFIVRKIANDIWEYFEELCPGYTEEDFLYFYKKEMILKEKTTMKLLPHQIRSNNCM